MSPTSYQTALPRDLVGIIASPFRLVKQFRCYPSCHAPAGKPTWEQIVLVLEN